MNKKIGDKIKYQEWHYGTIVAIKDGMAEIETAAGIKILKPLSKIVTDKQLPKYIDLNFGKYRFRYKGEVHVSNISTRCACCKCSSAGIGKEV